jgi:hypothetical protein
MGTVKVAAIQASPIFLDRAATIDKTAELLAKTAAEASSPGIRTGFGARSRGRITTGSLAGRIRPSSSRVRMSIGSVTPRAQPASTRSSA